jgi:hypothetical protein
MESAADLLFWAVIIGGIGLQIWAIVVCFQKGKQTFGALGIAGFLFPGASWFAIVGALRIGKPSSSWAQRRYDPQKMATAVQRFPDDVPSGIDPEALPRPVSRSTGRKLAYVAGGLAAVVAVAGLVVVAAVLVGDSLTIEVGECVNAAPASAVRPLNEVECAEPHHAEVYAVFDVASGSAQYPGDSDVSAAAVEGCVEEFAPFVGVAFDESEFDVLYIHPTEESWVELDDREVICMVTSIDGSQLTGSMRGSGR